MTLGFWDDDESIEPAPIGLPEPGAALEAGRAALVAGSLDEAALHLGIALRLAPALAPAVLEATAGARGPSVAIVRGDAYRLAGHEAEARNAYADAARGGPPERRKRARIKPPKPAAATEAVDEVAATDANASGAAAVRTDPPDETTGDPRPDPPAGHADDGGSSASGPNGGPIA